MYLRILLKAVASEFRNREICIGPFLNEFYLNQVTFLNRYKAIKYLSNGKIIHSLGEASGKTSR